MLHTSRALNLSNIQSVSEADPNAVNDLSHKKRDHILADLF